MLHRLVIFPHGEKNNEHRCYITNIGYNRTFGKYHWLYHEYNRTQYNSYNCVEALLLIRTRPYKKYNTKLYNCCIPTTIWPDPVPIQTDAPA
jgi:hypothetical protein